MFLHLLCCSTTAAEAMVTVSPNGLAIRGWKELEAYLYGAMCLYGASLMWMPGLILQDASHPKLAMTACPLVWLKGTDLPHLINA